ncbi:Zn-dependent exopeptidase [Guyanagaster necrorhizus]|uniref:Zn-dependent exopeptidase n=1 Tax=Guyanagaster necrorhizus TaxID=856835 RepID=A0A9P7VVR6_9AGAR|nr:Zn-dependent exopeptidase [Guyanagaster necrorhizus MCA 3950]KAG7447447.1 Zn-dependent exopeptidase [Guyanagaster necrorhizus MCA 3950]
MDSEKRAPFHVPFADLGELQQEDRQHRTYRLRLVLFLTLFFAAFIYLCRNSQPVFEAEIRLEDLGRSSIKQSSFPITESSSSIEECESLFLSFPDGKRAEETSKLYSKHPHLAGSIDDFEDAKSILKLFQSEFGIPETRKEPIFPAGSKASRWSTLSLTSHLGSSKPSAWIDVYYPVLNTPLDRSLDILGEDARSVWSADLTEDGDPLDKDAAKYRDSVPAWHGLSADGEAAGQLVYVNYGTKEDYDELVAAGVDFTGKIIIARYGKVYRGLKIELGEALGAVGALIYSDPRDDGFVTVENGYAPYPSGPARNPSSVQRGSVMYLPLYPGDPTTLGYPAYEGVERTNATNIPKIPSLPISWHNAQRLLEEIDDGVNPRLTGKLSSSTIKLVNHVDTKVTPIWNAMAAIPGHIRDEVVLVACHRDAWVLGAADPVSGTVALTEVIRGYGELLRNGWKPLRTVVFASWDAEEYGLIGSVEYGEDFSSWIAKHVVAYINVDVSSSGSSWNVAGSPALAPLIKRTALDIPHPTIPGKTLWDARNDEGPFREDKLSVNMTADVNVLMDYEANKKAKDELTTGVLPLGSGSDYTVFLQRLGVSSTDQGFGGTPYDAPYHYHSIYDSIQWQQVYADPGFHRHIAVAKHLGLMALRLIDSIIIPLNTTQYALELDQYLDNVERLAVQEASSTIDFGILRLAISKLQEASKALDEEKEDAEKTFKDLLGQFPSLPPPGHAICRRRSPSYIRITNWVKGVFGVSPFPLESAVQQSTITAGIPKIPPIIEFLKAQRRISKANKKLISFERGFISEGGIKGREWFKHLGVAPGRYLGYGATTLPALTEALSLDKNVTLAQEETYRLASLLDKLADNIMPSRHSRTTIMNNKPAMSATKASLDSITFST